MKPFIDPLDKTSQFHGELKIGGGSEGGSEEGSEGGNPGCSEKVFQLKLFEVWRIRIYSAAMIHPYGPNAGPNLKKWCKPTLTHVE